jgi:hypothetical protein
LFGPFGGFRLFGEIDDAQQLVAEPGDAGIRHQPGFLRGGFESEKAQCLAFSRLRHGQYVHMGNFTKTGAKLMNRGSQARNVLAPG